MSSVNEIMSEKEIVTITTESRETAQDVADFMVKRKVGSVIVLDKNGQHHGIITERDMVKRVCLKNIARKQNQTRRNHVVPSYNNHVIRFNRYCLKSNDKKQHQTTCGFRRG